MALRQFSLLDQIIGQFDQALRTLTPPSPSAEPLEAALAPEERLLAGRLMRVNHVGEVAAQALYQGQALSARAPHLKATLQEAAQEENTHLQWTGQRVAELGTHTSYLNPFWYVGSLSIGTLAGLAGDKWSLGFIAETEQQVVEHLDEHIKRLPRNDKKSRAILEKMQADEARHATVAIQAGGKTLPGPVKLGMRFLSKVMVRTAFWI